MSLGERIKEQRKSSGLSQEKVAEFVGVSRQAVTKWETGQSAPSTENLFKLAEIFGTTVDILLASDEEEKDTPAEQIYYLYKMEQEKKREERRKKIKKHIDKGHIHNHLIFNAVSFTDHKHYHSNKRSYHYIRRTSDRICKEHGLSVIIPGKDKGKSYIEHQAAQAGTSYKAKLKAAIDRLIPASADFEDLLLRLQREGYEVKRGKYVSCRASGQERFTRMKTLGADYTEETIAARIAGRSRPSKQPKQRDGRISLLIDIQNNIKAQENAGFAHWAKLNNLKQAARTMNFLTEHGIDSYEELEKRLAAVTEKRDTAHASIKDTEARIAELSLVMKHAGTYRRLKPLYDRYRQSRDKEKFMRGHESGIILFEAAARELKKLGAVPVPSAERMEKELAALTDQKDQLITEYRSARSEAQEYETIRQNVDALLSVPKEQEQLRRHELE